MKDFKRLYPFIRPYRNSLILSLLLLSLAGVFQSTTTTLSLPLFDKVLMPGQNLTGVESKDPSPIEKYVFFILSLIPARSLHSFRLRCSS